MGKWTPPKTRTTPNPVTKRGWKFLGRLKALCMHRTRARPCLVGVQGGTQVLNVELLQPAANMRPVNRTPCQPLLKLGTDFQMVLCTYGSNRQNCHKEQSTLQTSSQLTLEEENLPMAEVPLLGKCLLWRQHCPSETDLLPDFYFASFLPGPWSDCQTQGINSLVLINFSGGKFLEKN